MGIWEQLNSKTLFGSSKATAAEVNAQTRDINIEKKNVELLQDVNTINSSLMRDGRPMPGTGKIFLLEKTTTAREVWFTPNKGEVWKLINAGSTASSGPSGSLTYYLYIACTDQNGDQSIIYAGSESSGSTEVQLVDFFDSKGDWYVDENMQVQIALSAMQGVTTFDLKMLAIRVR